MGKKKEVLTNESQGDLFSGTEFSIKKSVEYTSEQREFIEYDGPLSVVLAATAGSGKSFSCVQRLKTLVERGVDPNKIIFFSFTKAATDELRERVEAAGILVRDKVSQGDGVTITTIHAFANSLLARMGKFKEVASFYEFLNWFKVEHKPSSHATREVKEAYQELIANMYEDADQISSAIGAFKLQSADNIKAPLPQFYNDYKQFLREKKKRDFSDMLIEVRDLLRENTWLKKFRGQYDYIFIDEYQDTSTIQLQILLSLNAKYYYVIGDRNQCVVEGTLINTENGKTPVENISVGDMVLSGKGSDKIGICRVTDVFKSKINEDVVKIETRSGRELITTNNHTHFAKYYLNEKELFFTYLMFKEGFGFRIGVTRSFHNQKHQDKHRFGFMNRINGEGADKIWLIKACYTEEESKYWEQYYSITYGLPTIVFKERGGKFNQKLIDRLFSDIDTSTPANKLLNDLGMSFDIPHHLPKCQQKNKKIVNMCLCSDGRGKNSIHKLEINGNNKDDERVLLEAGINIQDNGKNTGWRIRRQSSNYGDLMNYCKDIIEKVNSDINQTALLKRGVALNMVPASYLRKGMTVFSLNSDGEIVYDIIEKVTIERYDGYVYDINVENSHNFIANGIFTHNSIYGYSGANCRKLEEMLKKRRDVKEMTLSVNFRSDESIVENSNKYSSLVAIANSKELGSVNKRIMLSLGELIELLKQPGEIVVLVRTNDIIRKLEKELLKKQVPMRYFNFITDDDIKAFKKGDVSPYLRGKLNNFKTYFESDAQVIAFIERFKTSPKFVTTIHKSKGREFDECVVINSISPEVLQECGIYDKLGKKRLDRVSFTDKDEESRNIHYVAVSRSKHKLHFMIYE